MIHFTTNIEYLRTKNNLDIKDFVEIIGNKSYAAIHNYFSGVSEPKFKVVEKFARHFNVSVADIIGRDLKKLPPLATYKNVVKDEEAPYYKTIKTVPILPFAASAGILTNLSESINREDVRVTPVPSFMGRVDFFVPINGNSMCNDKDQRYQSGSYASAISITNRESIQFGKEYVFDTKDGLIFKTFDSVNENGDYVLTSINKKYDKIVIPEDLVDNIGLVTGCFTHV